MTHAGRERAHHPSAGLLLKKLKTGVADLANFIIWSVYTYIYDISVTIYIYRYMYIYIYIYVYICQYSSSD